MIKVSFSPNLASFRLIEFFRFPQFLLHNSNSLTQLEQTTNKMKHSRLKFGGINVLLACFGLSFLAACGGDESDGPQLELSTEAIQTTYVLGSAPAAAQIALRNIGDEVLTFSLGGTAFWVSAANATSGEVVPGGEAIVQFTLECSVPGDVAGTITISGNFGSDASVSASLRCEAPPVTVALNEPIPDSAGHPRLNAQSEMQWSIASAWSGQPAVDYTIVSSNELVTVDPAAGSVGLDDTVVASLDIACPAPGDEGVELRIAAGDGLLDAVWSVDCQGGSGEVRGVVLYQGPMAVREVYEADDSGENGTFTTKTFTDLIPGRDGVVTVRVEHKTDYLGEPAFSIVDGTDTSHLVESALLSVTGPDESDSGNYETEFMFPVPRDLFKQDSALRADIDVDGSDEGAFREHVLALDGLSFMNTPSIRIRLFPLENGRGVPAGLEEKLDGFINSVTNYMPISNIEEITIEDVVKLTGNWDPFQTLDYLQDHWTENGEADEYYHGVFIYNLNGLLGVAYLSGNVGMSVNPGGPEVDTVEDNGTFAHEMGHNFSLLHAPCGGPAQVDPDYPYRGGRLGPRRGWKFIDNRFIESRETYYDLQTYCSPRSVSDFNFGKAAQYLSGLATRLNVQSPKVLSSNTGDYAPLTRTGERAQSLALTGNVDDQGQWSFRRAVYSSRMPLPVDLLEAHSHIVTLFDANGTEIATHFFSPSAIIHGTGWGWGMRVAMPVSQPVELAVTDLDGTELLRVELEL